jgi:fructose-1,6-bisphosphatase/inositol monophosphatase family enzyme
MLDFLGGVPTFAPFRGESALSRITGRDFVDAMTLPVWQAMAAVRWLEGRVANRPKLEEITPEKAALTDGDCVSQEILLVALRACFPQVELSVEEDTPSVELFRGNRSEYRVVIDPIDGTLRYLRRDGPYAVLVGLERNGQVEASLVGLPVTRTLIRAVRGDGAETAVFDGEFQRARSDADGRVLLVSYGLPEDVRRRLEEQGLKLVTAAGGVIGVAPLLEGTYGALRLSAQPQGLSHRAWVAALPTLETGGVVEGLEGAFPNRYCPHVPGVIVGASAEEVAQIREALKS